MKEMRHLGISSWLLVAHVCLGAAKTVTVSINTAICSAPSSVLLPSSFSLDISSNPAYSPTISSSSTSRPSFSPSISQLPGSGGLSSSSGVNNSLSAPSSSSFSSGSGASSSSSFLITNGVSTSTAPSTSATVSLPRFLISFSTSAREGSSTSGYLRRNGTAETDCKTSTSFTLTNGVLSVLGGKLDGAIYSVDSGVASAPFTPSYTTGSIRTQWVFNGTLNWENAAFRGGKARFCEFDDGSIEGYYTIDPPSNCEEITFSVEAVTTCPGYQGDDPGVSSSASFPTGGLFTNSSFSRPSTSAPFSFTTSDQSQSSSLKSSSSSSSASATSNSKSSSSSSSASATSNRKSSSSSSPSSSSRSSSRRTSSSSGTSARGTSPGTSPVGTSPRPSGTSSNPVVDPRCQNLNNWDYFYSGRSYTLDGSSLSDGSHPPIVGSNADPANNPDCSIISACITNCENAGYQTMEVYYTTDNNNWNCACFYKYTTDPTLFTTRNTRVSKAFAYSNFIARPPDPIQVPDPNCATSPWTLYFHDSQKTLSDNNPANTEGRNSQSNIANVAEGDVCQAVSKCLTIASDRNWGTIDVRYYYTNGWVCYAYSGSNTDTSYYISDTSVEKAFGYSRTIPDPGLLQDPGCTGLGGFENFYNGRRTILQDNGGLSDSTHQQGGDTYAKDTTDCDAISQCAASTKLKGYNTFTVQYDEDAQSWYCYQFFKYTKDTSYFRPNTAPGYAKLYAYSLPTPVTNPNCGGIGAYQTIYFGRQHALVDDAGELSDATHPPQNGGLSGITSDCLGVSHCYTAANTQGYHTFNVVYNDQTNQWSCRLFYKYTNDQTYFANVNPAIAKSYAYALPNAVVVSDPGCTGLGSWAIFYYGSGKILVDTAQTLDDGANTAGTKNIDPSEAACDAVSDCETEAQAHSYKTFNVYFSVDGNTWVCNYWAKYTKTTELFQDQGSKVSQSYAYSLPDDPTPPAPPQDPQCNAIGDFTPFFIGNKKALSPGNEADIDPQGHSVMTSILANVNSDCSAVQACYNIANINGYHTFNVIYEETNDRWTCRAYYGYTKKESALTGDDADITKSYAYTQPIEDPQCSNIGSFTIFYHGDSNIISVNAAISDNVNHPGYNGPLNSATSDCDAIQQCYTKANQDELQTFNVWYQDSTDLWYCRTFYGYTAAQFAGSADGEQNTDFLRSFAYSYQTPPPPTINDPQCDGLSPFAIIYYGNFKYIHDDAQVNSDSSHPRFSFVLPTSTTADCDAISACKDKTNAFGYHTFNVLYNKQSSEFVCNVFYGYADDDSQVTQTDSTYVKSYAYSYPVPDDTLANPNCAGLGNFVYFFSGKRATLEPGNAADNDNSKSRVNQQYTAGSDCEAVQTCAAYANAVSYQTFDVYFSTATNKWICTAYAGYTGDPAQLTTGQNGIAQSYAYSYQNAPPQPVLDPGCGESGDWGIFYHDRGYVLDGTSLSPQEPNPLSKSISSTDTVCQALSDCITYAEANTKYSINLVHSVTDSSWQCVVFDAYVGDATPFTKVDSDAAQSYGYSRNKPAPPPTVDDPQCQNVEQYAIFYHGYGEKMDDSNSANNDAQQQPIDQFFSNYGQDSYCDAIGACKDVAKAPKYHTFEVYYITDGQSTGWQCRAYSGYTSADSYFSVAQPGILNAYGYSLPLNIDPNPPQVCNSYSFTKFFDSSGLSMATQNPANTYRSKPPISRTYPLITTECDAVQSCAAFANQDGYNTFDLHKTTTEWECVEYFGYTADAGTFSQSDDAITRCLGYSLPKPAPAAVSDPNCNEGSWANFLHDRGVVLANDNSASSADFPPRSYPITDYLEDEICSAVDECRTNAEAANYHTFNVFWTNYQWTCNIWQGYTKDNGQVTASAAVEESYAYSRKISPVTQPNCPAYNPVGWTNFYAGSFKDPTSIGTGDSPSKQITLDGSTDVCAAVQSCIDNAENNNYYTLSLRYDSSVPRWICIADQARDHDTTRFSFPDAYAPQVYGFYFPLQAVTNPSCGALSPPTWQNFYYGSQLSLDPSNPANSDSSYPAIQSQLDNVNPGDACGAIQACVSYVDAANYRTIDVHYDDQLNKWQCFGYHGRDNNAADFDQPNEKLIASYGYFKSVDTSDPNCGSNPSYGFTIFYHGSGTSAKTTGNPADTFPNSYGPVSTTFAGTTARCLAVQQCITYTNNLDYSTFDLYYDYSIEEWTCRAFYGTTTDTSVYNGATDPAIEQAYGYSRPQPPPPNPCSGAVNGFTYFGGGRQKTIDINSGIQGGKQPWVTTFNINLPECDAITGCANFADSHHFHTFNVRQDSVTNTWQCGAYYGYPSDPNIFTITDTNIIKDIGYRKAIAATPSCSGNVGSFNLIYSGNGKALVSANSANDNGQPGTKSYPPQNDICQVASDCSTDTYNKGYGTFQVLFVDDASSPMWMCYQYHGLLANADQVTDIQTKYDMSLVFTALSNPNCKANGLQTDFDQFYFGYSNYMPDSNTANTYPATYPSKSTNFAARAQSDQCLAISDCLAYTSSQGYSTSDISYDTTNGWQCTAFYGYVNDPSVFSSTSTTLRGAYGWSKPLAAITQPSCAGVSYPSVYKFTYFFGGRNKVIDQTASFNDQTKYSTTFASTYTDCQAADACAQLALSHRYATYEINLNGVTPGWTCNVYHGFTSDASVFSVTNTQIIRGYGYSAAVSTSTTCDAGSVFFQYYAGSGKRLPVSNPANDNPGTYPPVFQNIDPTLTLCDAVQVCKAALQSQSSPYSTFEVVFVDDATAPFWKCAIYHGTLTNSAAVTDTSATYGLGVGYSSLAPCPIPSFTEFFRGFGYALNQSNPAVAGAEVRSEEYALSDYADSCAAAAKCVQGTNYYNYHTFDIHADLTNQRWRCYFYKGETTDFNYAISSGQPNAPARFYSTKVTDPKCNTQWTLFFSGSGKTLSSTNPANSDPANHPPLYQTNAASYFGSECAAINGCRQYAQSNQYHTFELHVVSSDSSWSCAIYYGELQDTDTQYFVADATAGNVFGYHTGNTY